MRRKSKALGHFSETHQDFSKALGAISVKF